MTSIESVILRNLIVNKDYVKKVIPFIKEEYFSSISDKELFLTIRDFISEYKTVPTIESLVVDISNNKKLSSQVYKEIVEKLKNYSRLKEDPDYEWLVNSTEKFCQDKAMYNAIMSSVSILEGRDQKRNKGAIPSLMTEALAISFDTSIGHDYFKDNEERFLEYRENKKRIRFDLDYFNKITGGGLISKTLNIIMASVGTGKTLFMCHFASSFLMQGYNVLYITMEMAEEKIAERIDANILNIPLTNLRNFPMDKCKSKFKELEEKSRGKLIIKEYPTSGASVLHFRALLNELKLKKSFVPDIIFVDYLNICTSSRVRLGGGTNSYTYVKAISEELRGFGVENDVPIITATQSNRTGSMSSDPSIEDTSESWGVPATGDLMFVLISNPELEQMNQIMVKQLKNRYSDLNIYRRFIVGVDKAKMKLYDVEMNAQEDIVGTNKKENENDVRGFKF